MKHLLILLAAVLVITPACKKSTRTTTTFMNTATIKGQNLTVPACGAAFFITIHGITDSNAQFNTIPASSGIDLSTATFPLNIKLNWHAVAGNQCNVIIIDEAAAD